MYWPLLYRSPAIVASSYNHNIMVRFDLAMPTCLGHVMPHLEHRKIEQVACT